MIKWFIDKNNRVPLYLQLKDLIKYYLSTGEIKDKDRLPGVNVLARELKINFETVRKAYRELEKEGLLVTRRAKGTYATLHPTGVPPEAAKGFSLDRQAMLTAAVARLFREGLSSEEVRESMERAYREASSETAGEYIIFTECNSLQANEIAALLKGALKADVRPVLLTDLAAEVTRTDAPDRRLKAVVTTGFHVNEVRKALAERPIPIHLLITNMTPESRRQIESYSQDATFGFICRDGESIQLYKELLKAEFGKDLKLETAALNDEPQRVNKILKSADVLLVTPPVYDEMKAKAPAGKPVFNVFERVDPLSLLLLKDDLMKEA